MDPEQLNQFVGEWTMEAVFPEPPPEMGVDMKGRVDFQWMPGEKFLIERWEVPDPVPNGIAVIGFDEGRGTYLQHYFDSRGVARVYEMTVEEGVWRLSRTEPDFSPLEFSQRFTGKFSDDGHTIDGRWEICRHGSNWEVDFDLIYRKVR